MANDLPETDQRGNLPDYNWIADLPDGTREWIFQVGGTFRSAFLPTGLLDFLRLSAHPTDPVPPGRTRLYWVGTVLYFDDGTGPMPVGGGVDNFLALLDTPGNYVGQAGLVVAVNGAEDGLEFVAGGGGGGASAHHYSYPTIYYPGRISFPANTYTGLAHWPGWTVVDENFNHPTANTFNGFLSSPANQWGRETDANTGRRVTYVRGLAAIEENTNPDFNLYRAIPGDFTGWDPEGITISHRIVFDPGPAAPGETTTIVAEVYDPTNAGDVVVASASRVVTGATDAGYVDLVIPEAALTAAGFAPGDMLRLRIRGTAGGGFVSNEADHRISRIQTAWVRSSGGGGGGPASPLPCSDNTIAADLTVPSGKTCYAHDILVAAGVTVTIESGGELLVL